jgi:hypothetical protein
MRSPTLEVLSAADDDVIGTVREVSTLIPCDTVERFVLPNDEDVLDLWRESRRVS